MTDYVGPLQVQDCLDRLIERLGEDWFRSPYTRLSDVLSPDDSDMKIILELRQKTHSTVRERPRRRRSDSYTHRLTLMREDIKAQLKAGWSQEQIASAAGVSRATMSGFIQGDAELHALFKQRGTVRISAERVLQVIQLHKRGYTNCQIRRKIGMDQRTVSRIVVNYEVGAISAENLQRYK